MKEIIEEFDDYLSCNIKDEKKVEKLSISHLVDYLNAYYKEDLKEKNIDFSFQIDQIEKEYLYTDQLRLNQIYINILSNAIKYTPDGGRIEVTAGLEGGHVFILVSDNGIGIPEKDQPHLFERFYRVDKARSRQSGGTGLGLSIAREILDLHQGSIRIHSRFGEGTDVRITLPSAQ